MSWPNYEREGPGASYVLWISRGRSTSSRACGPRGSDVAGITSTEAAPMIQTHWFLEQPVIVRTMIGFVVPAVCLLTYLLTIGVAALLDPDVY